MTPIRVAFIKYGGLSAGGTERWLQTMAASLPTDRFTVTFFYCDGGELSGLNARYWPTDPNRLAYLADHGVAVREFHVGRVDWSSPEHIWVDTDFWDIFDPQEYDLVQTAKAGPKEYPYYLIPVPVVEFVTLDAGADPSASIVWTIHLSQWQRARWFARGGHFERSSVIPIPAEPPASALDLRCELNIGASDVVAGFHQRVDDRIFSPVPLDAFARIQSSDRHFIIMGGSLRYRQQAEMLDLRGVHFLEHASDPTRISEFLNTLDVFAHGRHDGETFGAVFAEAMRHGLPCVSHYAPAGANAQRETIGPGGYVAKTVNDYATHLEALLSDEAIRQELGEVAQRHADGRFTPERCVADLVQLYTTICHDGPINAVRLSPEYGESKLGFLWAGHLSDVASVDSHVITRETPYPLELYLARRIGPLVGSIEMLYWGHGITSGALATANPTVHINVVEADSEVVSAMTETIHLNRWSNRVTCRLEAAGAVPDMPIADAYFVNAQQQNPSRLRLLISWASARSLIVLRDVERSTADGIREAFRGSNIRRWDVPLLTAAQGSRGELQLLLIPERFQENLKTRHLLLDAAQATQTTLSNTIRRTGHRAREWELGAPNSLRSLLRVPAQTRSRFRG